MSLPPILTWLNLVRKSAGLVDGVEGLAEVVGDGVGGGDDVLAGLDLDLAVAAGGLDELPDRPAGLRLGPPAESERGEHDRQVGLRWSHACSGKSAGPAGPILTCGTIFRFAKARGMR